MELVPLGPGFGVEVKGVTMLDVATDAEAYKAVRAAFEEHSLLVFRDQPIADDIQVCLQPRLRAARAHQGGLARRRRLLFTPDQPRPEGRDRAARPPPGAGRQGQCALAHRFLVQEDAGAGLGADRARACRATTATPSSPRRGCAWERLPADLQARLKDAVATHSYANSRDQIHPDLANAEERKALPPVRWRLNWRNPANDRRALYVASHAYAIDGMDDRDARQLLAQLLDEATRREFVYTHKWRQGDAVMWDNRAMLHRGRPWDYRKERSMIRTTISATDADGLAEVRPPVVH